MNRPNILFCLADDAGLHFGAYGCRWVNTPAFDRVARGGLLFQRGYTPNAKCAPSRAAILTGRNSWQLEDAANHNCIFPARFKTVWEALQEAGYHTGHTAKGWAPGDPGTVNGRPRELTGPAWSSRKLEPPTPDINNTDYAGNFEDFLNARPADAPFCFWYGSTEPHRNYTYGSGVKLGKRSIKEIDHVPGIWPDNEVVRNDLLDYGFEIEHFDRHLGQMLDTLQRRGLLENTLVVVTSDNGMPFPRIKGQEYEHSNHMPLAMMWPAGIRQPGRVVHEYVSFIDFAPTFLELAGLDATRAGMQPITGRSLTDVFAAQPKFLRDHVLIGKERHDCGRPHNQNYPIRGIFEDGWLYLRNFEPDRWPAGNPETGYLECDGSPTKTEVLKTRYIASQKQFWDLCFGKRGDEELYHVAVDPDCLTDLVNDPAHQARRDRLRAKMEAELRAQGDPRMFGNGEVFERYPWCHPWLADYYERWQRRHETGERMEPGWIEKTDVQEP